MCWREALTEGLARMRATRPKGETQAYQRLESRVRPDWLALCDGCTRCASRCTDGIQFCFPEFAQVMECLTILPETEVARVLGQEKTIPWESAEAIGLEWQARSGGSRAVPVPTVRLCPFLDRDTRRCLVYVARPLVCRLFGIAPWLPCPAGRVTERFEESVVLVQAYATLERKPLRAWLVQAQIALPGLGEEGA